MQQEIEPPWIKFPGYPPPDGFWRQSGEYWLHDVWAPFWKSLNAEDRESYLKKWNVPNVWKCFSHYLNPDLDKLWEERDPNMDLLNRAPIITEVAFCNQEYLKQEKIKALRVLILWTAIFHPFIPMALWVLYKNPLHMNHILLFINFSIPLSLMVSLWKMWSKYLQEDYSVARYYCILPFMVLFVVMTANIIIFTRPN
jgi:hypothetical protein